LFDRRDLAVEVGRLGELFTHVEPRGIWYANADELVAQVGAALG
jgi:hypothetical protein